MDLQDGGSFGVSFYTRRKRPMTHSIIFSSIWNMVLKNLSHVILKCISLSIHVAASVIYFAGIFHTIILHFLMNCKCKKIASQSALYIFIFSFFFFKIFRSSNSIPKNEKVILSYILWIYLHI